MTEPKVYKKVCRICNSIFESTARNTKYCTNPECHEKAKKISSAKNKTRRKRRKEYYQDSLKSRMKAMSHQVAVNIVEWEIEKAVRSRECEICELVDYEEVHHCDGNPYNNTSFIVTEVLEESNLGSFCKKCHAKADSFRKAFVKKFGRAPTRIETFKFLKSKLGENNEQSSNPENL